ncbi:MAG: septum formation initiator family protein [Patescibacteria group bacterium]
MISWRSIIIVLVVALLGVGIYNLQQQRKTLNAEAADLRAKFEKLKTEKNITIADIEYFKKVENRLKEAKKQLNLVRTGEKLIIVVPEVKSATTTVATSTKIRL